MQSTHTVLMVRLAAFRRNEETAVNNFFQGEPAKTDRLPELALAEFDQYVETLTRAGLRVIVLQDPANWTHRIVFSPTMSFLFTGTGRSFIRCSQKTDVMSDS